jgi:hypothetical protein
MSVSKSFGGSRRTWCIAAWLGMAAQLSRVTPRSADGCWRPPASRTWRTKPDNLRFAHEGTAFDVFASCFLNKNVSPTLAVVALGPVARHGSQNGVHLSPQGGF